MKLCGAIVGSLFGLSVACSPAPASTTPAGAASHPTHHEHGQEHGKQHEHGHHGGPLVRRFEDAAYCASKWEGPERDASQRPADVVAALQIEPGMTVVDLGTGTGYFLPYLSPVAGDRGRILALDIEAGMVEYVRKRASREGLTNVTPRLVKPDDPELETNSIDRILVVNTWHHIPQRQRYAAKLREALKAGGTIAIVEFTLETEHGPSREHRVAPEVVIAELRAGGLQASLIDDPLPDHYIVIGTR